MAAVDRYLVLGAGHDLEQMVRRVPEDIVALLAQIGADSATAARRIALRQIADYERRAGLTLCPIIKRRAHTRGDRQGVVEGKRVYVRSNLVCGPIIKKKKWEQNKKNI